MTALAKALAMIDAVLAFPHPVSLPDLTDRLREGRGTVHRRLRQLEHEGLPLRDPRGHVTVGPPSEALVETVVAHGVTPQQRRQGGASAGTEPCLSRPPHL